MPGLKIWAKGLGGVALLVAAVRLVAGRWDLPMVWIFVVTYVGFVAMVWFAVFRRDPELLRERQQPGPGAKDWDRVCLALYSIALAGTLIVVLLDVGRFQWSEAMPLGVQVVGLLGFAISLTLGGWAMSENRFFSEVVRIQRDRGHYVVTSGPYHYVRHPSYLGNIVAVPCMALALGSGWALVPAGVVVLLFVVRTALEDRTLCEELDGYVQYAQQVRYRLVPGVW